MSYYAVKEGYKPGVYNTWNECAEQVKGYSNAKYKKFDSLDDAKKFVYGDTDTVSTALSYLNWIKENNLMSEDIYTAAVKYIKSDNQTVVSDTVEIYVDGSFNAENNQYGYGIYMISPKSELILFGSGLQIDGGRNVEGEVAGAINALEFISRKTKYKSVTINYDYKGIEAWANDEWKANKEYTIAYKNAVAGYRNKGLTINYNWTHGHTGIDGNEFVDKIAKVACGVALTNSEKEFLKKLSHVKGYNELIKEG